MVAKSDHYSNGMLFTHLYICVCGHGSTQSQLYHVMLCMYIFYISEYSVNIHH